MILPSTICLEDSRSCSDLKLRFLNMFSTSDEKSCCVWGASEKVTHALYELSHGMER